MQSNERLQSSPQTTCWNSRLTAALWALEDGAEAGELTQRFTRPYGQANARRIVDVASARLWFAQGFLAGEIRTMLEARRRGELPAQECRAYVIDILLAVQRAMAAEEGTFTSDRKETENAAA